MLGGALRHKSYETFAGSHWDGTSPESHVVVLTGERWVRCVIGEIVRFIPTSENRYNRGAYITYNVGSPPLFVSKGGVGIATEVERRLGFTRP